MGNSKDIVIGVPALARLGMAALPVVITRAGGKASRRFLEFFTANIRNKNTRLAYARAIGQFLMWCERRGLSLAEIDPLTVSIYREPRGLQTHGQAAPGRH